MSKRTLLIDFDGVIHKCGKGYGNGIIYDEPMEGAEFTIKNLIEDGYDLWVFTSRTEKEWPSIQNWLEKHNFPRLPITNIKIPARAYIDNRGIRFTNWADIAMYFL